MSLTPRVLGLAEAGFDPLTVSHMLGISFAEVNEALLGHEVAGSSNEGVPTNWCRANVKVPPLNKEAGFANVGELKADALHIESQAGDDIAIGEHEGEGALFSTAGGLYWVEVTVTPLTLILFPEDLSLRTLSFEAGVGDPPLAAVNGIVRASLVAAPGTNVGSQTGNCLGYTKPGGLVVHDLISQLSNENEEDKVEEQTVFLRIIQVGVPGA